MRERAWAPATAAAALLWFVSASAVTISIDRHVEHQTVEGFGAFGEAVQGEYHSDAVNDLGLTILRTNIPHDNVSKEVAYIKGMGQVAEAAGVDLKVIASCWTPPVGMKANHSLGGEASSNILRTDSYDDFARHCVSFLDAMPQAGIDIYALSLQNEPAFSQPFVSCYYTADTYEAMAQIAVPIIREKHPDVKLFGAEHMLWAFGSYEGRINANPDVKEHFRAFAVHGYADGVNPVEGSKATAEWQKAGRLSTGAGMPLWMTEASGFAKDWGGAMLLAEQIYAALRFGNLSAWVWWSLCNPGAPLEGLMTGAGVKTPQYWVSRHYYRWIRPGAVRIDAVCDADKVFVTAFNHKKNRTLTVVAVNSGDATSVSLAGEELPARMQCCQSTSGAACADKGMVSPGDPLGLPAQSVTTLYGEDYGAAVGARPAAPRRAGMPNAEIAGRSTREAFDLHGRRLDAAARSGVAVERLGETGSARLTVSRERHKEQR